jgi:hypothetical protein
MDFTVLKKKLSTFKTSGGKLTGVSNDLLVEVLRRWEAWTGTSREFQENLDLSKSQLFVLTTKAKKICKSGDYPHGEFKEIKLESSGVVPFGGGPCGIEISWENGKIIRFSQVEQLVDFLKKVA